MKLRHLLTVWRTFKIPGLIPVMKDWRSFIRMNFLYAAMDAGLLEALKEPASQQDLAAVLKAQRPELLDALLDVGLALKELKFQEGQYHLSGKRSRSIVGPGGDVLAALIQAHMTYYNSAYRQAGNRIRGGALSDDINDIGDLVARFSKIGEPVLGSFIRELVKGRETVKVLDVGCGSGVFLKHASQGNPAACGIGIDLDEAVADLAKQNIAGWGLTPKFKILRGDIRQQAEKMKDRFDIITLFNLVYYFHPDERLPFFRELRLLLSPGGTLAIAMNFQSQGKDLAAANLNLVNCSLEGLTGLPDVKDLGRLLEKSGFENVRTHRLMPPSSFYGLTASVPESS